MSYKEETKASCRSLFPNSADKITNKKNVIVLDNGAYFLKFGSALSSKPRKLPNFFVRTRSHPQKHFISLDDLERLDKTSMVYYHCFLEGYLSDWNIQSHIWQKLFEIELQRLEIVPENTSIVVTEPINNPRINAERMYDILFNQFGFHKVACLTSCHLAALRYMAVDNCGTNDCVVVDTGYSFTHIVPYIDGRPLRSAQIRVDVGGATLTDHLKSSISFRQLDLLKETFIVNDIKEKSCFVALDFKNIATSIDDDQLIKVYNIPDFISQCEGTLEDYDEEDKDGKRQKVVLDVERYTIPEFLFQPSLIDIDQAGIAESTVNCINRCPEDKRRILFANIVLIGGNAKIPGLIDRFVKDLRGLCQSQYTVCVFKPQDPDEYAWHGGKILTDQEFLKNPKVFVRKDDYLRLSSRVFNAECFNKI